MFLQTINKSKNYNFMFAFVGDENAVMQNIMEKIGASETGLKSYLLKM